MIFFFQEQSKSRFRCVMKSDIRDQIHMFQLLFLLYNYADYLSRRDLIKISTEKAKEYKKLIKNWSSKRDALPSYKSKTKHNQSKTETGSNEVRIVEDRER